MKLVRSKCIKSVLVFALAACFAVAFCASCFAADTEVVLHSFHMTLRGEYPNGGLIADSVGNLYGVTSNGGIDNYGTVFELSPNAKGGWTETVLYNFQSGNTTPEFDFEVGYSPTGSLVFDKAGNLYGATSWGGKGGAGIVFKLTHTGNQWVETVLWNFLQYSKQDGFNPRGGLIFDSKGNLYGTTTYGGGFSQSSCSTDGGCGTVFRLSPLPDGTWHETRLYVFQGQGDGLYPNEGLAMDSSGRLYGTAFGGTGYDVAFQLTPTLNGPWTETIIASFAGSPYGANPGGDLVFDSAGNLFGTTSSGGSSTACYYGCGTVFELLPEPNGQWNQQVLYSFTYADGEEPQGKLAIDQSGNIYGTALRGGTGGGLRQGLYGVVFKLSPDSSGQWTNTVLWNFTGGADGQNPSFGVIQGSDGRLYGAATPSIFGVTGVNNIGSVFEISPSSAGQWVETTLTNFPFADGGFPQAGLAADAAGNLYGTTSMGGAHGYGVVFRLSRTDAGWAETILYNFPAGISNGAFLVSNPSALTFDAAGNLYGETQYGGGAGLGNVFEVSPTAKGEWTAKNLFTFKGAKTGAQPLGGVVFDSAGNLYGTTQLGGTSRCGAGCGTAFELTPSASGEWTETLLYTFSGESDGGFPEGGLIFDEAGNLYGTTYYGGDSRLKCSTSCGTVFKLSPGSGGWTKTLLYQFSGARSDGRGPMGSLVFDPAGNLYGTTTDSGNAFYCVCGAVFELSPTSGGSGEWSETVVALFGKKGPSYPEAGLIIDRAGNLYGTSLYGGGGYVFELSPSSTGWVETDLYAFDGFKPGSHDGNEPAAALTFGPDGTLYGTTTLGGTSNWGTVFAIKR
jgi:uncharacterized repeat protein (TIGR03803 family)